MKTVPHVWVVEERKGKRWVPAGNFGAIASRTRKELPAVLKRERVRKYVRSGE